MTVQDAYKTFVKFRKHVEDNTDAIGKNYLLKGARMLTPWQDTSERILNNIFDYSLNIIFHGITDTNTSSDECCTIVYKNIYMNILEHYGCATTGLYFGFFNNDGDFLTCSCTENKEFPYRVEHALLQEQVKNFTMELRLECISVIADLLHGIELTTPVEIFVNTTDCEMAKLTFLKNEVVNWGKEYSTLCGYEDMDSDQSWVLQNFEGRNDLRNFDAVETIYNYALKQWNGFKNRFDIVYKNIQ